MKKGWIILTVVIMGTMIIAGCFKKPKQEESLQETMSQPIEFVTNTQMTDSAVNPLAATDQVVDPSIVVEQQMATVSIPTNPGNKDIQQALKNAGLYQGKIDGSLGAKSKQAIKDFQAQNDLKADGKVGPKTWAKLGTYLSAQTSDVVTDSAVDNVVPTGLGE